MSKIISPSDCFLTEKTNDEYEKTNQPFFEGAEKLLEIWFYDTKNVNQKKKQSLRNIPFDEIVQMLNYASCHILHSKSTSKMDSYVLSESSLFISDHRLILKTCGTTNLLQTIPHIIKLAKKYSNINNIANVYYSRKNFLRFYLQPDLHKSFNNEILYLDSHFKNGKAYCIGSITDDCWYLYIVNNPKLSPFCADHCLEILMSDLPTNIMKKFTKEMCKTGPECTLLGGIKQLFSSNIIIDEELFDPVGYSMNGLYPDTDQYATIHVTPEPEFSYVSFETNQDSHSLYKQTLNVLNCFNPKRAIINLFSNNLSKRGKKAQLCIRKNDIPRYKKVDLQILHLQNETVIYTQLTRIIDD